LHEYLVARLFEPGRPRGFALFKCEGERWILAVATLGDVPLPVTLDEMLDFGADAAPRHVLDALRTAEPLGNIGIHRFPSNRWRRYDKMSRTPDGFVVVGDAVCSFNPIYGQGMTVAAIEATILHECLRRGEADLPSRFFEHSAKWIRLAWQTAVGSDLALPEVTGPRPWSTRLGNAYVDKVLRAAEVDRSVAQQFMRVTGMLDTASTLMRPTVVARVIGANLRPRVTERATPADAPTRPVGTSTS
jgi:2-polyprenyl-6-methoxyphenol hydroxylase-like FAD-dependent oxidoreductase